MLIPFSKKGFVMKNDKPLNYTDCVKLTLFVVAIAIMLIAFLVLRTIIEFHAYIAFVMIIIIMIVWHMTPFVPV